MKSNRDWYDQLDRKERKTLRLLAASAKRLGGYDYRVLPLGQFMEVRYVNNSPIFQYVKINSDGEFETISGVWHYFGPKEIGSDSGRGYNPSQAEMDINPYDWTMITRIID